MTDPYPPAAPPVIGYANVEDRRDADHLRLLSIFHYVYGGLSIAFSSIFIFHIVMGVMFLENPQMFAPPPGAGGTPPPPMPFNMGWFFIGFGSVAVLIGWTSGILTIVSGRRIARRRSRTFSIVIAGLNCLSVPFGTALGVFTLIVLLRDSVRRLYASGGASQS